METTKIPTQYSGVKTLDKSRVYTNQTRVFLIGLDGSTPAVDGRFILSERSDKDGTCYMGVDWRSLSLKLSIRTNETLCVMFCDLRGVVFDNLSLSNVEFFGCRLDGASFRGTRLHEVQFIGCFSSEQSPPTDFQGTVWVDSEAKACHLNYVKGSDLEPVPSLRGWPVEVVEAANKTLDESREVRSDAVSRLGKLANPIVVPYLANLLVDPESKVRVATVRALGELYDQASFAPDRDEALLKWIFLRLGDKHPKVRHTTRRLIKRLQPSSDVLRFSIRRMRAHSSEDKVAGLYAAIELAKLNSNYSDLWELETVHKLLSDESAKVREAGLTLLKIMDNQSTVPWVLETLSDPDQQVRAQAIRTMGWVAGAESAKHIVPLLSDPGEQVRIRALYTLRNIGQLQPNHVAQVLVDDSPTVLQVARELLLSWNGSREHKQNGSH